MPLVARAWLLAASATLLATLAVPTGTAWSAEPDAVYRCGPGDYRAQPCPGGHEITAPPPPTAAERIEAERVAQREARLARELERDRVKLEKSAAHQGPMALTIPAEPTAAGPRSSKSKNDRKARKERLALSSSSKKASTRRSEQAPKRHKAAD